MGDKFRTTIWHNISCGEDSRYLKNGNKDPHFVIVLILFSYLGSLGLI